MSGNFGEVERRIRLQLDEDGWQCERRDAWVRFAAAAISVHGEERDDVRAGWADTMLAEFDARFGKKEEGK